MFVLALQFDKDLRRETLVDCLECEFCELLGMPFYYKKEILNSLSVLFLKIYMEDTSSHHSADDHSNDTFSHDDKHIEKTMTFTNLSPVQRDNEATSSEIKFLKTIMKKASAGAKQNMTAAKKFKRYNNIIATIARVLATLAGSAGLGSLLSLEPSDPGYAILAAISVITIIAAILQNIQGSLNFDNKALQRKNTASDFNAIVRKIAQFLSTPGQDRKDIEIFTNSVTIEMNVIDADQDI